MATSSKSITNVSALSALVEFAKANGFDDTDVIAKVERHIAVLSKPKAKSDQPSKVQMLNRSLAEQAYSYLAENGQVTAKGLVDGLGSPYVTSSQKATIIMSMLVADGRAVRNSEKGKVWWTMAN